MRNEKGMALIVAIFVTIFLLLVSVAFFTSSGKEVNRVRQNWAGVVSAVVTESGAERAVWYVQKQLDSNSDWKPSTSTTEVQVWGNYDNFVKNYGDKTYQYADYGVKLIEDIATGKPKEYQASQVYAVKMVKKDDPNTEAEEWLICSAGATRFAQSNKGSAKEMKVTEILVRLGRNVPGTPEVPAWYMGKAPGENEIDFYKSGYVHVSGMKDGKSAPATIYTKRNFDYVNNDLNPDYSQRVQSGRIGWGSNSNIILKKDTGVITNDMENDSTWKSLMENNKLTIQGDVKMDFLDLDFDAITKGKNNGSTADYTAAELVASGAWIDKGTYYQPKDEQMYLAGATSSMTSVPGRYVYKDGVKGTPDGSVIIYIPPGKGFRHGGTTYSEKIFIENGVHGIIVSEGAFTSTGNATYGNSQDAIANVGVDIRAEIHSVGGPGLNQGILKSGNQTLADYKLGVAYSPQYTPGDYNVYGMYGATGGLLGCVWQDEDGNPVQGSPQGWGEPLWSDTVGVLDILSTNNVILSNQWGNKNEGVSRFRGYISSKKQVLIQGDFAMRGAIGGKEGVTWSNQWQNGLANGNYGGYDSVLLEENPLKRGGLATYSLPKPSYEGSGGDVNSREIVILAWNKGL